MIFRIWKYRFNFSIQKQHDCWRRIQWKNKQSSQLLFVIIFCFATNAVHNVILPYHKTSSFIKLHFFYKYRAKRERERERKRKNFLPGNCIYTMIVLMISWLQQIYEFTFLTTFLFIAFFVTTAVEN